MKSEDKVQKLKGILLNLKKRASHSKEKPNIDTAWFSQYQLEQSILEGIEAGKKQETERCLKLIEEFQRNKLCPMCGMTLFILFEELTSQLKNHSQQDSVNQHSSRGAHREKDVRCNSEPTADTNKSKQEQK